MSQLLILAVANALEEGNLAIAPLFDRSAELKSAVHGSKYEESGSDGESS